MTETEVKKVHHPIDKFFRRFFQEKQIIQELLVHLVKQSWVNDLDFSTLERVERSYITKNIQERASDVIWKVKYKTTDIYIDVLTEIQSSNDVTMPIRILDYIGSFYENEYKSLKSDEKIIPMIPIVFYVGSEKWTAVSKFHDLVNIPNKLLKKFIPSFEYILINIDEINTEKLLKAESLLTRIVAMNKSKNSEELRKIAKNLFDLIIQFKNENDIKKYKEYLMLYIELAFNKKLDKKEAKQIIDDIEGGSMFFITLDHIFQQEKEKGKEEGIKEGKKEGLKEGKIEIAKKMLKKGSSVEDVAEMTELSIDEIEKIKKEMKE